MNKIEFYPELLLLYNKNDVDIKKKIIDTLNQEPSKCDCDGYIYGFYSPKDKRQKNNFWIKLGRTERNPFNRAEKEWNGKLIFCLKTRYNHRLERLMHLFFDYAREPRINTYNSQETRETKKTKETFLNKILCCFKKKVKVVEENKEQNREIEWFHFKEKINIPSLTSQIWQLVEDAYSSDKESEIELEPKLNINTASLQELILLPNVSKAIAQKIIDYRQHKKFTSIDEIRIVHKNLNIKYNKIRDKICV
jgi:DNA uptake protein ComE-like DNA-binding protein